jgi:RNA-binding protein
VSARPHAYATELTSAQRASLKGLAHALKPVVLVGNGGITDGVVQEITHTLNTHELVKIQLPGQNSADEKEGVADTLRLRLPAHAHLVSRIGRSVILYLEKAPEDAKLILKELR